TVLFRQGRKQQRPTSTGGPMQCSGGGTLTFEADQQHGATTVRLGGVQFGIDDDIQRIGHHQVPVGVVIELLIAVQQIVLPVVHTEDEVAIASAAACRHPVGGTTEKGEVELRHFVLAQQGPVELTVRNVLGGNVLLAQGGDGIALRVCTSRASKAGADRYGLNDPSHVHAMMAERIALTLPMMRCRASGVIWAVVLLLM